MTEAAVVPMPKNNTSGGNDVPTKRKRRKKKKKSKNANEKSGTSALPVNTANVPTSSSGVRKRNRNAGGSSKSKNQKSKQHKHQQQQQSKVHLPHTKITLRNIQNDEKFGSVSKMINLLRRLIKDRNQAVSEGGGLLHTTTNLGAGTAAENGGDGSDNAAAALIRKIVPHVDIVLDEASVEKLLERERKMQEKELKNEHVEEGDEVTNEYNVGSNERDKSDSNLDVQDAGQREHNETPQDVAKEETKEVTDTSMAGGECLKAVESITKVNRKVDTNVIAARVLYMVPPRKSRRRGQISGHCYLALYPPMPLFIQEKINAMDEQIRFENVKIDEQARAKSGELNGNSKDGKSTANSKIDENLAFDSNMGGGNDAESNPNARAKMTKKAIVITSADRSKALAQARLLLSETVVSLSELCNADAKKDQNYGRMQILTSPSQKIWKAEEKGRKNYGISAKYEGTIEQNEDFQMFIESKKKFEEDRMNRPKPQPGGGPLVEISSTGADEKAGVIGVDGEPMAAIVLHLLEKKAAKKRAKSAKTAERKKAAKSKSDKSKKASASKSEGDKTSRAGKKKRQKKKKSKNKESSKKTVSAPKILMKKIDAK